MTFPTLVYRCPGNHFAHSGQTYDYAPAQSDDELQAMLADGWHHSLCNAVDAALAKGKTKPAKAEPDDNSAPTRAEIEAKAAELGIKFDGRTGDAALLRRIDEALSEQE